MSEELFTKIGQSLNNHFNVSIGQMFGKPCLKSKNKKAFVAFQNEKMVFKLGSENISQLINKYSGAVNWDPSNKNRPMKDWIQIPDTYKNDWEALAKQALDFIEEN